jgi:hypothetical protein
MKKFLRIFTLVVILTLMVTSAALAAPGGNPRGEVIAIDEAGGTITLQLSEDTTLLVILPSGFDPTTLDFGMTVMVKGDQTDEGFVADWVREVGAGDSEEDDESDSESNGNAWGEGGAYCNQGKDAPHPIAAKIGEDYDVDPEWVMSYACDGHGFGGVMLALQSQQAGGEGAGSADDFLNQRKQGKGWGQIWKDSGLVGNPSAGSPPPGQLKKQNKDVGPPEGKGWNQAGAPNPNSNGQGPKNDSDPDNTGEEDVEQD